MEAKIIQYLFEGVGSILALLFSFFIYFWVLKKIFPSRKRKETDIMSNPKKFWRDSVNITFSYIWLKLDFYLMLPVLILIIILLLFLI